MSLGRLASMVVVLGSVSLGSCVDNSASIYIQGVVPIDTSDCSIPVGGTMFSTSTTVDAAFLSAGGTVNIGVQIANLIRQRNYNIATDTSSVIIEEAELSVGGAVPVSAVVPGSADGITPGLSTALISIPGSALASAAPGVPIVVDITLHGRTLGDIEVEGGPFSVIIYVNPANSSAASCEPGTGVRCCRPGQDGERYCADPTDPTLFDPANRGLCAP